jgi:hypothetical protein
MSAHRHTALRVTPAHAALPSPVRAAAPYAVILAVTAIAAAARLISGRPAAALASAGTAAAALAALWAWFQRARLRDLADRFIATGSGAQPPVEAVIARRAELTSPRERRGLARSMSEAVAVAKAPPAMSARVPLDRRAVVAESALLGRVAWRLAAVEVPVAARGVALAELLVTDCASPLYRGAAPGSDELHRRLTQILFEIERAVER